METPPQYRGLICYGYGAARRMGPPALSEREEQFERSFGASATLFTEQASLRNAEEWLLRTDYLASKKGPEQAHAQSRLEQVTELLVGLLPDVKVLPHEQAIRIPAGGDGMAGLSVEIRTHYGWVPMRGLSLGYQTLIAWMVDLAARLFERYPDSRDPLAEPAIVLVDEIDLHLHPSWQRTLMQFLGDRFPKTQFIATAHSPLVVQAANEANTVVLRREGDHVLIDNDVKTVRGWRVDQVLASDLFGRIPTRPPDVDSALEERKRLIAKGKRTATEEKRLRKLDKLVEELPTAERPEDIEAMEIIRRAARHLKNAGERGA
jgi:hypothetical protein